MFYSETYYRYDSEAFDWPVVSTHEIPCVTTTTHSISEPSRDIFPGIFGFQVEILGCT